MVAILVAALATIVTGPADAATFTVTNVFDAGPGSLRAAITSANATPGPDVIAFNVQSPTTSTAPSAPLTFIIGLLSPLDPITDPVVIDGSTQPGFVAGGPPLIGVRGFPPGAPFDGVVVQPGGSGSTIRNLSLTGFEQAIQLEGTTSVTVSQNLLGLLPSGPPVPNVNGALLAAGATGNTLTGNTVSGNTGDGVVIEQSGGNRLVLNRIGTDPAGAVAVPNGGSGVAVLGPGAGGNLIGEVGAGNLISGNGGAGVRTQEASGGPATANSISGNFIGLSVAGTAPIGNGEVGVSALQSVDLVAANVISGNAGGGLHADLFGLSGFVVRDNRIGTNSAGTAVVTNGLNGVSLSGGAGHAVEGNLVSGNVRGIDIDTASGVRIQRNLVGTDVSGTIALGNSNGGIQVADGLDYLIGGPAGAGNVVAGNTGFGVIVFCLVADPAPTSAVIQGNRIGTNQAGTAAIPNTTDGVVVVACAAPVGVLDNVISGNGARGVVDNATATALTGNLIGTDAAGTGPLGNGSHGVELAGSGAEVNSNTIAFNGGAGVLVSGTVGNEIRSNRIHDNAGLGIDLVSGGLGVTPNDAGDVDEGPNRLQNSPVLTAAVSGPSNTVTGTLQSLPSTTFTIELFANTACDPSGAGEGETFLTSVVVTTDAAGAAAFTATVAPAGGPQLTATATDPAGNTSEFSACLTLAAPPGISISDVSVNEGAGVAIVTVTLPAPAVTDVSVTLSTSNGTATAPADYTATATTVVIPAGQQSATVAIPLVADTLDENDETFTVTLSNPVGGVIGVPQRTVTIVDDDPLPALSIGDVSVAEGNAGTTALTFTVTLSAVSGRPVTVAAATSDGSAVAGSDYQAALATLAIPPGATSATFTVLVIGDVTPEPNETFTVTLSSPTNAVLADATATGVIAGDDAAPVTTATTTVTVPPPAPTTSTTTAVSVPPSVTTTTAPRTVIVTITPTTQPQTRIISITQTPTTPAPTAPPVLTVPPTAPATTVTVAPTSTSSTSTSTSTSSTSTTLSITTTTAPAATTPTTSTTVPPAGGPPPAATLSAIAPDGSPGGPPGVGLAVAGEGYAGCATVYFFFDGVRVGSDKPDATGTVSVSGLSVPGDALRGDRRVTSTCRAAGGQARAEAPFTVVSSDVHRPAFLTALPQPRQVSTDADSLLTSGIVAVLLLILLAFPSQLFNATFTENYDEIRGWFRLPRRVFDAVGTLHQVVAFGAFAVVGGLIYSFLSPDFGFNLGSLALLAGMTVAVAVVTVGFAIPSALYMRRHYGEWGKLAVLPGSLLVGLVCLGLSRLLDFQPGYLYGVLAGLVFARTLVDREQGRMSALTAVFIFAVSIGAWALRVPVSSAAAEPGADVWLVALESSLGAIFLLGLESIVVGLLPMRFLDGARVKAWSTPAWAVLFTVGLFALVHVLLSPGSGYVGHTSGGVTIAVIVLYVIFGAISVAFWAYFRYRPARFVPEPARDPLSRP